MGSRVIADHYYLQIASVAFAISLRRQIRRVRRHLRTAVRTVLIAIADGEVVLAV